jgi:N-formylglutamate amidohydrolase
MLERSACDAEDDQGASGPASAVPSASFERADPPAATTPLVHASSHSGRFYPSAMMAASHLDADAIRRSEDAWVDALIASAPLSGGPLLKARYARAYVDLNRAPYELDPGMFEDQLPRSAEGHPVAHTARAAAGLGSIARVVGDGQEIYRRKLTFAEARARIETVHAPWHQALEVELDGARARFGSALLLDWHSMPSGAAGPGRRAPDIVLGDRHGSSCAPAAVRWLERELEARGYLVARNAPYAGGYTAARYGRPAEGLHALQIEINRGLYLDERTLKLSSGFAPLQRDLDRLLRAMARVNWRALLG